jgi:hypothetical protein
MHGAMFQPGPMHFTPRFTPDDFIVLVDHIENFFSHSFGRTSYASPQ